MSQHAQHMAALGALWSDDTALADYLAAHSNLPGPRGNLEMMAAFADLAGAQGAAAWPRLVQLAGVDSHQAPTNDPREVLPCCAAQGFGAVGAADPAWRERALTALRALASDARWRVRESVAMGLQRLLAVDFDGVAAVLRDWTASGDPLVMRAVVAGVAEPALLTGETRARDALALMETALAWLRALPLDARREEGTQALRKALGYTLSVATAAAPDAGFALMLRAAAWADKDVAWALKQNLDKKRLARWPEQVSMVRAALGR